MTPIMLFSRSAGEMLHYAEVTNLPRAFLYNQYNGLNELTKCALWEWYNV
jgi:hypothetical protein